MYEHIEEREPAGTINQLWVQYYTLYLDSLSFTGGSKADIHWSHAPFTSICKIAHFKQVNQIILYYFAPVILK